MERAERARCTLRRYGSGEKGLGVAMGIPPFSSEPHQKASPDRKRWGTSGGIKLMSSFNVPKCLSNDCKDLTLANVPLCLDF